MSPNSAAFHCFLEVTAHREHDAGSTPPKADAITRSSRRWDYDEFLKTGFCGAMPCSTAFSNSVIESNNSRRKWLRISSQRWHLVFILSQAAWNWGQHSC